MNNEVNSKYDVTDLTSLEKLEPVRVRPGMYIGSTGTKGLHHCIWEILDNSIVKYLMVLEIKPQLL